MNKATLERATRWYGMYLKGSSMEEIADHFGVTRQAVSKAFADARLQYGGFEVRKQDETALNRQMALHYIRAYALENGGAMPTLKQIAVHLTGEQKPMTHVHDRIIQPLIANGELVKVKGGKHKRGYALPEGEVTK